MANWSCSTPPTLRSRMSARSAGSENGGSSSSNNSRRRASKSKQQMKRRAQYQATYQPGPLACLEGESVWFWRSRCGARPATPADPPVCEERACAQRGVVAMFCCDSCQRPYRASHPSPLLAGCGVSNPARALSRVSADCLIDGASAESSSSTL